MPTRSDALRVYETGRLTVLGFGQTGVLDEINVTECYNEIAELVRLHDTRVLAFDLTDVVYVPSALLGVMATFTKMGVEVHLYNLSPDVREVLDVTRMIQLFQVHELVL